MECDWSFPGARVAELCNIEACRPIVGITSTVECPVGRDEGTAWVVIMAAPIDASVSSAPEYPLNSRRLRDARRDLRLELSVQSARERNTIKRPRRSISVQSCPQSYHQIPAGGSRRCSETALPRVPNSAPSAAMSRFQELPKRIDLVYLENSVSSKLTHSRLQRYGT